MSQKPRPKWPINRRAFLGAMTAGTGVLLLDRLRDSLISEARAAGDRPKRLVIFVNGNGLHEERYKTTVRSETDFDLPPIFAPLQPYKQDLIIVQKLFNPHNKELHGNGWATLSVVPSPRTGGDQDGAFFALPSGVSLDRHLAREIGGQTPFPSINLGLLEERESVPHCSSDGPGRAFPAERSPVTAYSRLFGPLLPRGGIPTEKLLAQDKSVLDRTQRDIQRTLARLAGPERAKMEQYLESIRALELRLSRLGAVQAACAGAPAPAARLHDLQQSRGPVEPEVIQGHIDVAFNALACGLTRIAAISMHGRTAAFNPIPAVGSTVGHHIECHDLNNDAIQRIDTLFSQQVAVMLGKLKGAPEGSGTMLDNTLVMWINSGGGLHHSGWNNHAVVLAGKAGGALRTGRYLTFPLGAHCVTIKLGAQVAAALLAVGSGLVVDTINLPLLGPTALGWAAAPLTLCWILFATNAMNFIDGINGLAAGVSALAAAILALIAASHGGWFVYFTSLMLAAGLVGFLPFNFPRARIFMGDVGSQFCGFVLAVLAVAAGRFQGIEMSILLVPMLLFGVLYDVAFTLARRLLAGERVTQGHRGHLYQVAHRAGLPVPTVTLIHWGFVLWGGLCCWLFLDLAGLPRALAPLLVLPPQLLWTATVIHRARTNPIGPW